MLQVDVENNRVIFCAEGIPLYEPLLEDEWSMTNKKKSATWGCFLLSVATFSTLAMVFFFAIYPNNDAGLDALSNDNNTNSTSIFFPFEVTGPLAWIDDFSSPQFQAMEYMKEQEVETTTLLERFALVTLFFATNGIKWKTSFEFLNKYESVCDWNDGRTGVFCDEERHSVKKLLLGMYRHR